MKKYFLSICIVSYNRKERLFKTVNEILKNHNDMIQIVISDDSTNFDIYDEVRKKYSNYDNLKYIYNNPPLGIPSNWIYSLLFGDGEYVLALNDRDSIFTDKIQDFINLLLGKKNIMGGYCVPCDYDGKIKQYKGVKIIEECAYRSLHPSGFFFKRDWLYNLKNRPNFYDFTSKEKVGFWPHDFIVSELYNEGTFLWYSKELIKKSEDDFIKNNRSSVDNSSEEMIWFAPKARMEQLIRILNHVDKIKINCIKKLFIFCKVFYRQHRYSTIIYKKYMNNENECLHYGIKRRIIYNDELIRISNMCIQSYKNYINQKHKLYGISKFIIYFYGVIFKIMMVIKK